MIIDSLYPWVKAFHVIAIICWLAAMLYLPRLFVYHCGAPYGSGEAQLLTIMEKRLNRFIMLPAMVFAWLSGLWLAYYIYRFHGGWLHLKLLAVVLLSGFHGFLSASSRRFAKGENRYAAKTWRLLNEVPTVLMIIIVIAVIVKPF